MLYFSMFSILLHFPLIIVSFTDVSERKLIPSFNPGCIDKCGKLFVVEAPSSINNLNYLWDFGRKLTFLIAEVPLNTTVHVNWTEFPYYLDNSIYFNNNPSFIFGIMINKIYEFNDVNDSGVLNNGYNDTLTLNLENFNWTAKQVLDNVTGSSVRFMMEASGYHDHNVTKNGTIRFIMHAYGADGHAEGLPHLFHTDNCSQIDLIIDGFTTSFSNSRFAIELITFSSNADSKERLSAKKTLDDENTPGIFTIDTLYIEDQRKPKHKENNERDGFLQWRPIVYVSKNNIVSNSTKTLEYDIVNVTNTDTTFDSSLLYALYGKKVSNLFIKALNVSFGSEKDGFYKRTRYLSWSFLIGVGKSPEQPFSLLVLLVISIGIGLPSFILLGAGGFTIYRRIKNS